jgi:hypothetical protein
MYKRILGRVRFDGDLIRYLSWRLCKLHKWIIQMIQAKPVRGTRLAGGIARSMCSCLTQVLANNTGAHSVQDSVEFLFDKYTTKPA